MRPRIMLLRGFVVSMLLGAAAHMRAQLASTSPFLPSASSGVAVPTQNAPLEFRGLIENADGVQYRIFDPARKGGVWVKLNERNTDYGVLVKQYDADRNTVTVEHEGKTLTLEERKAKVVSSGSAVAVVPPVAGGAALNMNPAVTQSVVAQPTPADEQKRLEAVAQEVARRRALREQAATNPTPVQQPSVQIPQVQMPPAPNPNANNANGRRGPQPANRQQR